MLTFDLDKIKRYLKLPVDFTDDDKFIHELFDYIIPDVEKFIGFDLSATTYTDEIHILPWWERTLQTKAFPILDPVITINDGDSVGLDNFNYNLRGDIYFKDPFNLNYGYRENVIKSTYRAGYEDYPKSAEKAIYKLVKYEYEEGGNDLQSISDLSSSQTKRDLVGNFPVDVYRILNSYRRNII